MAATITDDVPDPQPPGQEMWEAADINFLHRFLCFGTENAAYSMSKDMMREDRMGVVQRLIDDGQGELVVDNIKDFSVNYRSSNQKAMLYALALCAKCSHEATKKAAYNSLQEVCTTPPQLFQFLEFAKKLSKNPTEGVGARGWGKMQRKAINKWYNSKTPLQLANLVTKYRQRHKWSHLDVVRLAHIKPVNEDIGLVLSYVVKGLQKTQESIQATITNDKQLVLKYLEGVESIRRSEDATQVATVIEENQLVWEHVPTKLRKEKQIWQALLRADMPMTAVISHLTVMASHGMLTSESEESRAVIHKLGDDEALKRARIHPLEVLKALLLYEKGQGSKGKLKWTVNDNMVEALTSAHHNTFKFITPTNQRYLVAIDLSKTMTEANKNNLSPAMVATTVAMTIARTEENYSIMTFKGQDMEEIELQPNMSFKECMKRVDKFDKSVDRVNCSLPMEWALRTKKKFDVIIIFTNEETVASPRESLLKYRREMGIFAKLVVCSMSTTVLTTATPKDAGMLDICGVDAEGLQAIRNLASGKL